MKINVPFRNDKRDSTQWIRIGFGVILILKICVTLAVGPQFACEKNVVSTLGMNEIECNWIKIGNLYAIDGEWSGFRRNRRTSHYTCQWHWWNVPMLCSTSWKRFRPYEPKSTDDEQQQQTDERKFGIWTIWLCKWKLYKRWHFDARITVSKSISWTTLTLERNMQIYLYRSAAYFRAQFSFFFYCFCSATLSTRLWLKMLCIFCLCGKQAKIWIYDFYCSISVAAWRTQIKTKITFYYRIFFSAFLLLFVDFMFCIDFMVLIASNFRSRCQDPHIVLYTDSYVMVALFHFFFGRQQSTYNWVA